MLSVLRKRNHVWLVLFLLVISSNLLIYRTSLYEVLEFHETPEVVIGSLIDFLLVAPLLLCLYLGKLNWKKTLSIFACFSIFATIAIPKTLLAPYKFITNVGIVAEVCLIAFEVLLILLFLSHLPNLIKKIKTDLRPLPFSYNDAVLKRTKNPIIQMLSSELLVFYYAFFCWKKKPMEGISLHKNSSYVAMQVMILHAIVLESLGFHWWLHSKAPITSIVLLILNVYGFIFILADLQAMRLNRIVRDKKGLYVTFGLLKQAYIEFENIGEVILDKETLELKKRKDCSEFICRDFEEVYPQVILKMKKPQEVRMMYGFKQNFGYVAIKCDEPEKLLEYVKNTKNN